MFYYGELLKWLTILITKYGEMGKVFSGFRNCCCFFFNIYFYPSIYIYPTIFLSIYLSIYLLFYLSIHLSIYPSFYPSIFLSIHLSIHPSISLSIHLSIHPSLLCICSNFSIVSTYVKFCRLSDFKCFPTLLLLSGIN